MSFKDDIQIDEHALMWECARQPMLFHQYAIMLADAQVERAKAKDELDLVKAQLDESIRADPGKYGLSTDKKPTEAAIAAQVIQEEDYKTANDAYIEAEHEVNKMWAAKDALAQKKSMLESMVRLHLADWNADPSLPPKGREAVAEAGAKEHREALPKRLGKAGK